MISSVSSVAVTPQFAGNRPEPRVGASREEAQASPTGTETTSTSETEASISELATTDRQVRAHEAAHMAAAGALAQGGASFSMVRGPDGQMYAIGGEVSIDVSPARTPEGTVAKAEQIRRAALAPADPSAQDYRVAAQAAQLLQQAQRELAAAQADSGNGADGASTPLSRSLSAYADTAEAGGEVNLFA